MKSMSDNPQDDPSIQEEKRVIQEKLNRNLLIATSDEDIPRIKILLSSGADVNAKTTEHAQTPLIIASIKGNLELVKLFIDKKAHIDAKTIPPFNQTALMFAIHFNRADIVSALIEAGANANIINHVGKTAFDMAEASKNIDIKRILTQHKKHLSDSLFEATTFDKINSLLIRGADINAKNLYHRPFLTWLSWNDENEIDVLKELVKIHTINLNAIDNGGYTALHWLAQMDGHYSEIVAVLLDAGADVCIQDQIGRTALQIAIVSKHHDIATLLIEAHVKQFYCEAKNNSYDHYRNLVNKHNQSNSPEAPPIITHASVCRYIMKLVNAEPDIDKKFTLLKNTIAVDAHPLSAFLHAKPWYDVTKSDSASVVFIKNAMKELTQPAAEHNKEKRLTIN